MRARRLGCGMAVALAIGCGGGASPAVDGAALDRDSGALASDAAAGVDSGVVGTDAGPPGDAGPPVDSGVPEVCTGGADEDGDRQIDCEDDECWSESACALADVARMVPDAILCGDPIELDAAETAAACTAIGMPASSTYETDCAAGTSEVTARVFCDASGAPVALWIEERLETPVTTRMITARRFERTYYDRASVIDWERHVSGASAREGSTAFPIHDGRTPSSGDVTVFRVISVRPVVSSDAITRLLGVQHITSIIDFDLPMSMDTRSSLHVGGLAISVPSR